MATTKELSIVIAGVDKGATKVFKEVDAAAGATQNKLEALGEQIGPKLATAAAGVVLGVGLAMRSAFMAADESAKISRETERVIRTTGAAAWTTSDQIGDLATSISNLTGADDEMVQSGANMLLTFTNVQNRVGENNDVFDQATAVALDLATAYGTDMQSAVIQVGKALNDPIKGVTALSKAGVQFTKDQREQIKVLTESGDVLGAQKIILGELQLQFGGAAEAAGTPLEKLRVKVGNLQESMGGLLLPVVGKIADGLSVVTDAFMALPAPVQNVTVAFGALGAGGLGVVTLVAKMADVFGDTLSPILAFAKRGVDSMALGIGELATKLGASQKTGANLASSLAGGVGPALGAVGAAAVVGFGIWSMYSNAQANADAKTKEFTDTLDANSGALTANTVEKIRNDLTEKNRLDNLTEAGLTVEEYTRAIEDNTAALSAQAIADKALLSLQKPGLKQGLIEELRAEGGARGDLVATMIEQGTLDTGMIAQLESNFGAYDLNIQKIKDKAHQTALANNQTKEEAEAAAAAAGANALHAESIKEVAEELRAQTDPYFAAFQSQQQLNEANANYEKINNDTTKSEEEKQAAFVAAATAARDFQIDLLELSTATGENGQGFADFNAQLDGLVAVGLNNTGVGAETARDKLDELGRKADELSGKSINIPVNLHMKEQYDKFRELMGRLEQIARLNGDTATADKMKRMLDITAYERGGVMTDGLFMVGENGPELGVKSGGTVRIFSNPQSSRMLSGVGAGSNQTIIINMPAGADGEQVVEAIKRYERRAGTGWRN